MELTPDTLLLMPKSHYPFSFVQNHSTFSFFHPLRVYEGSSRQRGRTRIARRARGEGETLLLHLKVWYKLLHAWFEETTLINTKQIHNKRQKEWALMCLCVSGSHWISWEHRRARTNRTAGTFISIKISNILHLKRVEVFISLTFLCVW